MLNEDKNLLAQYKFIQALKECKESFDTKQYVNESVNLALADIDTATVKKSNAKLRQFINENNIKANSDILEEKRNFFNNCNYIFTTKKQLTNIDKVNSNIEAIVEYVEKNKKPINENKSNKELYSDINIFAQKFNTLKEDEQNFIGTLISPINEKIAEKKELFENCVKTCIESIDKCINDANKEEKESLVEMKKKLSEKKFNSNTVIKDVLKLLEINSTLND